MTWVKLATGFGSHPKMTAAGHRAQLLYIYALCFSVEHELDGRIPRASLAQFAHGLHGKSRLAQRLVDAGLWHESDANWTIHGYTDWQRTKDEFPAPSENGEPELAHLRVRAARAGARTGAGGRGIAQEQNREEKRTPPIPPKGGRQRDQGAFREACDAYASEHAIAGGGAAVRQATHYGGARTLDEVKAFVAEHWEEED